MKERKISESAEAYVDSGDKGCGVPGSKDWLMAQIKQTEKVADLKLIAIDLVERCFDGNSE